MKTLSLEEATAGLGRWVELAIAGERIQIRKGNEIVELCHTHITGISASEEMSPREALHCLQKEGTLTQLQAEQYLREVSEERLTVENRRSP